MENEPYPKANNHFNQCMSTNGNITYADEIIGNAGAEFLLSKNFALMASYDNRFFVGGGLSVQF